MPNTIELSFAKKDFVDAIEYDILCGKIFSNEAVNELLVPSKMEHNKD